MKINVMATYEETTTVAELRRVLELLEGLGLGKAVVLGANGAPVVSVESAGTYHARHITGADVERRAVRLADAQDCGGGGARD